MSERLQFQGHLAEKELEARSLKLQIEGLRDGVRNKLDPFETIEDLGVDQAFELMSQLAGKWLLYKEILGEIRALKKALGRPQHG